MSDQTKIRRKVSASSRFDAEETSKLRENIERKPAIAFDDSAEMFRGLITGDEHYHSRSSSDFRLWG